MRIDKAQKEMKTQEQLRADSDAKNENLSRIAENMM